MTFEEAMPCGVLLMNQISMSSDLQNTNVRMTWKSQTGWRVVGCAMASPAFSVVWLKTSWLGSNPVILWSQGFIFHCGFEIVGFFFVCVYIHFCAITEPGEECSAFLLEASRMLALLIALCFGTRVRWCFQIHALDSFGSNSFHCWIYIPVWRGLVSVSGYSFFLGAALPCPHRQHAVTGA